MGVLAARCMPEAISLWHAPGEGEPGYLCSPLPWASESSGDADFVKVDAKGLARRVRSSKPWMLGEGSRFG